MSKDSLYGIKDSSILPALGSQSQRGIWFIFPAHGASHILSADIALWFLLRMGMLPGELPYRRIMIVCGERLKIARTSRNS